MANIVIDACGLIAFIRREQGGDSVRSLLSDDHHECYVHSINLCEVYYDVLRAENEHVAHQTIDDLLALDLVVSDAMDSGLWQAAGRIKAVYRRISLADCFGIALTQRLNATFVTADHHELDPLVAVGAVKVQFIR